MNVILVGSMVGSQIQQGSPNAAQAFETDSATRRELEELMKALKESFAELELKPDVSAELQCEIQTIEAQMSSPKLKGRVVTECLHSIRSILEGAAGSALASALLPRVVRLLAG